MSNEEPEEISKSNIWPDLPVRIVNGISIHYQEDTENWHIELRRVVSRLVPHFSYGSCKCCNLPWWIVEGHVVNYHNGMGMFAICEMCWRALGSDRALPYYIELINDQKRDFGMPGSEADKAMEGLRQNINKSPEYRQRERTLDEVIRMLQGVQTDAVNMVSRGNIIDRVKHMKGE